MIKKRMASNLLALNIEKGYTKIIKKEKAQVFVNVKFFGPDSTVRLEKRNARERNRVMNVNKEFNRLKELIVTSEYFEKIITSGLLGNINTNKCINRRLSKLKILKFAIAYIKYLRSLLDDSNNSCEYVNSDCSYNLHSKNPNSVKCYDKRCLGEKQFYVCIFLLFFFN
jgi:hypothetical protein